MNLHSDVEDALLTHFGIFGNLIAAQQNLEIYKQWLNATPIKRIGDYLSACGERRLDVFLVGLVWDLSLDRRLDEPIQKLLDLIDEEKQIHLFNLFTAEILPGIYSNDVQELWDSIDEEEVTCGECGDPECLGCTQIDVDRWMPRYDQFGHADQMEDDWK